MNLRTGFYRTSQNLSRKVARIQENADCFWKPKKVRFFKSLPSLQEAVLCGLCFSTKISRKYGHFAQRSLKA
jgi:hypothetical protein